MSISSQLVAAALVIAALMVATWLVSVAVHDASIVDVVWGLGFVLVAWVCWLRAGDGARDAVMLAMVTVWGLRLAGHLAWRNLLGPHHDPGEDRRYQSMRRRIGPSFWIVSLLTVFALQGVLMWIVSLPVSVTLGATSTEPRWWLMTLGVVVWLMGMVFETVGDAQLTRFRSDPANDGAVMDRGLWRFTRHPNYFGDCCAWWGIWLVALDAAWGWATVVGPIVMTVLLVRVSGVALLERSIGRRRPGYDDYVARTSAFVPRPPRRSRTG